MSKTKIKKMYENAKEQIRNIYGVYERTDIYTYMKARERMDEVLDDFLHTICNLYKFDMIDENTFEYGHGLVLELQNGMFEVIEKM